MSKSGQTHDDFNFLEQIPDSFSGLLHPYQNAYLADDSLSDVDVVLLCIHIIESKNKEIGAPYDSLKDIFSALGRKKKPNFDVAIHRGKKQNLIDNGQDKTIKFQIGGLRKIEKLLGQIGKSPVYLIKAGESFSSIKLFEEFLKNEILGDEVLLCDSWISASTLFPFVALKGKLKSIKVLTSNLDDSEKFKVYSDKLKKEANLTIEVRKSFKIHDRYLISNGKCWSIGTSIKDFGNKDTFINELSSVSGSLEELFKNRWDSATVL